jgi:hypothetical protein
VELLHSFDVFLGRLVGFRVGVVEFVALKVSCSTKNVSEFER